MSNPSSEVSIEEIGAEEILELKQNMEAEEGAKIEEIPANDSIVIDEPQKPDEEEPKKDDEQPKEETKKEETPKKEQTPPKKEETPKPKNVVAVSNAKSFDSDYDYEDFDDEDDLEDETLVERLVGLTEMFPKTLRSGFCGLISGSISSVKSSYGVLRTVSWIASTSAIILFLPTIIESERMGIEEAQKMQQRQMLLGPGAAISGADAGPGVNAPLPPSL